MTIELDCPLNRVKFDKAQLAVFYLCTYSDTVYAYLLNRPTDTENLPDNVFVGHAWKTTNEDCVTSWLFPT